MAEGIYAFSVQKTLHYFIRLFLTACWSSNSELKYIFLCKGHGFSIEILILQSKTRILWFYVKFISRTWKQHSKVHKALLKKSSLNSVIGCYSRSEDVLIMRISVHVSDHVCCMSFSVSLADMYEFCKAVPNTG